LALAVPLVAASGANDAWVITFQRSGACQRV
jgi:hypothetical protein